MALCHVSNARPLLLNTHRSVLCNRVYVNEVFLQYTCVCTCMGWLSHVCAYSCTWELYKKQHSQPNLNLPPFACYLWLYGSSVVTLYMFTVWRRFKKRCNDLKGHAYAHFRKAQGSAEKKCAEHSFKVAFRSCECKEFTARGGREKLVANAASAVAQMEGCVILFQSHTHSCS